MYFAGAWVSASQITKDKLCKGLGQCNLAGGRWWWVVEILDVRSFNGADEPERRPKLRFRIDSEVKYKLLFGQRVAEKGTGRTLNISSGGVWFTTEKMLTSGMPVELSLSWPVLLNDSCPMKLMIYGCVVRSNEKGAAVAIDRYEFRTSGARTFQQPSMVTPNEMRLPG
jgi:hypothetical protein